MRKVAKTVNKLDTIRTMFFMMPAFMLMMNAAIAVSQGKATPEDLAYTAGNAVTTFTEQYTPYISATSSVIQSGLGQAAAGVTGCLGSAGNGPIHLNPAMNKSKGCGFSKSAFAKPKIQAYKFH